jgi:3-deoxy-D-manno-octulosonic-acid transferase
MRPFYQIFIKFYPLIIWLASPFNQKAKKWVLGRRVSFSLTEQFVASNRKPIIWMHCASLGEFEQGLPVLERLKYTYNSYAIVISFFSPSGYEVRKNHPIADFICYLPMDSKHHANRWLDLLNPSMAIFVKYEFWFHYLHALELRKITCLLVSAIFRKEQVFFQSYGEFYRKILKYFTAIMVQDEDSLALLQGIGLSTKTSIAGDTRFDRVITIAKQAATIPIIVEFLSEQPAIICGSTWLSDDKAIAAFAHHHSVAKYIIAPHEISEKRIMECMKLYPNPILYTEWLQTSSEKQQAAQTLIINTMGMLSSIYQYAAIAFIGGGFDSGGIHNTLEAAVYGVPVVFGPVYQKYLEAIELVEKGGAIVSTTPEKLSDIFTTLLQQDKRKTTGAIAKNYVVEKAGAVEKVVAFIQANRLLTN